MMASVLPATLPIACPICELEVRISITPGERRKDEVEFDADFGPLMEHVRAHFN